MTGLMAAALCVAAIGRRAARRRFPTFAAADGSAELRRNVLWSGLSYGSRVAPALIDTGASFSILPRGWLSNRSATQSKSISSRFRRSVASFFAIDVLEFGGRSLVNLQVTSGRSSYGLVGLDILLSRRLFRIGSRNVRLGSATRTIRHAIEVPIEIEHGAHSSDGVRALYLFIEIDGKVEKVHFDTGRPGVLEASAFLPAPENRALGGIEFIGNPLGQSRFEPYFKRTARLKIGKRSFTKDFRHYYRNSSSNTSYIMGAAIFEVFDIEIDLDSERALFFPLSHQ